MQSFFKDSINVSHVHNSDNGNRMLSTTCSATNETNNELGRYSALQSPDGKEKKKSQMLLFLSDSTTAGWEISNCFPTS